MHVIIRRLNPLHCGAVVASRSAHDKKPKRGRSLNPLHCGAVVASWAAVALSPVPDYVS